MSVPLAPNEHANALCRRLLSRFIAGLVRERSGASFGNMLMTFTTDSASLCALAAERLERTYLVRLCRGAG